MMYIALSNANFMNSTNDESNDKLADYGSQLLLHCNTIKHLLLSCLLLYVEHLRFN